MLWFGLLAACASTAPVVHESPEAPEVVASWEESCEEARTLLPLCDEKGEECGLYRCREVVPREALLAYRGSGPLYIPMGPASPRRWWGRPIWLPRDTEPVLTFRFYRHFDPKPQLLLPPGRWVRHHIFPQAEDLRLWFRDRGVENIHDFTLLIPEHVHIRIHSGGPSGGMWNEAWRRFRRDNPDALPPDIYRHAGELIFRFELTGRIVPYYKGGG
ncbi:MAG TPA: TIGR02269 family lipoprotein [Archangium sp.]|nr:TIGR02269 family lipoprotein [Archangium sp.]